ncbi:MAG: 30S ribosome-binding factor RbfA [Gemmatimonadota bacterium]
MTHHRSARLNEQFKREISHILTHKVRDPRVGPVLVTEVRVTADLWLARVFIRPVDDSVPVEEILEGLAAAASFIRRELAKVLRIRRIPELRFLHDTTLDFALRIEEVLKEVIPEGGQEAGETGIDPADPEGAAEGSEGKW